MKNAFFSILLLLTSLIAYSFDKGVGINSNNKDSLWNTSLPYAIARQGLRAASGDEYIVAFQDFDTYVFGLSNSSRVIKVNKDGRSLLGNWSFASSASCDTNDPNCIEPWWNGRWSDQEFLEPEIKKRLSNYDIKLPFELSYGDDVSDAIGCLEHTPLRYGDIDEDTNSELVIFLKNSLVIFSPKEEKVIFSSVFNYPDFVTWQTLIDAEMYLDDPDANTPQYASLLEFKKDRNAIIGYRGYSKLFIQDFGNDQKNELVVWRKFYQSRLQGDNVKGFEKLSDSYLHYKKVNGEYQLQTDTAPETIQGWLDSKNLTWQKGFPSKSECAGQEGQLIPEMHDPLLNDPDVLK
ncbi:MAG: hypothetical protein JXR16_02090 [Bermanella sp.]